MSRLHVFRDMIHNESSSEETPEPRLPKTPFVAPGTTSRRCECGQPLASNVRFELMTGMCDRCISANPEEANERWQDAMESYREEEGRYGQ